MQDQPTWREVLGSVIQDPQERRRIAHELGINPVTLTRWVNKEANPRPQSLQRLLKALPQHRKVLLELVVNEFEGFTTEAEDLLRKIPSEFYNRVLRTLATIPQVLRFSSLCDLILQQALEQLDPQRSGLAIIVARCMPPSREGKIRSLRESMGRGTQPWEDKLDQQAILLGAESLAGHAVTLGHPVANQNLSESKGFDPGYHGLWEESATAAPIMLEGNVAGCLLVSSTQPNYFLPSRQALIESYADLVALTFEPWEFYETKYIELGLVPLQEVQQAYLSGFRQRLSETMMQAVRDHHPLSLAQAEQMVWQQFEDELLRMPYAEETNQERARSASKGAVNDTPS